MKQTPAATSLLTTLVSRGPTSPWRLSAVALLESGKLEEGNTQQALAFLREAVETSGNEYIWRADAEANLGLALIMTGDEAKGLHFLHCAQERFAASRDAKSMVQCLENEANYLQQLGRSDAVERIRLRILTCEASARN